MGHLANTCKYLKRRCTQDKCTLFSVSTRGSINIRECFITVRVTGLYNKLSMEVVGSPSKKTENKKKYLDMFLGNWLYVILFEQGVG